jgi:hypothetical protein
MRRWAAALALIALAGCGATQDHAGARCVAPGNHWFGNALLHEA